MMTKRTSKRRWKARALLGRPIPRLAIVEHDLNVWLRSKGAISHDCLRQVCTLELA